MNGQRGTYVRFFERIYYFHLMDMPLIEHVETVRVNTIKIKKSRLTLILIK
jgi:hypothetical protein